MRRAIGVFGELLLTAGVLVLLFAAYITWGTGAKTAAAQEELRDLIVADWEPDEDEAAPKPSAAAPDIGDAVAVMRVPRFGEDWEWVVVEGVDVETLHKGPGHYPSTALPGQAGNFSVAGHRATYGEPFADFESLRKGDRVEVETKEATFAYQLTNDPVIIYPTDTSVVDPVPGKPRAKPTKRLITLTSCHPRWASTYRIYVHGKLVDTTAAAGKGTKG